MKDRFEMSVKKTANESKTHLQEKDIVWKAIEQKLHKSKVRKLYIKISVAASIIIIAGITALMTINNRPNDKIADYYCEISAELSETEFYYASLIEEKKQLIEKEGLADKQNFQPFFDEMDELDKQFDQYKKDISKYGYQEELIRAMIENQQQKLDVLNRLLLKIKKIKHYENRKKDYSV